MFCLLVQKADKCLFQNVSAILYIFEITKQAMLHLWLVHMWFTYKGSMFKMQLVSDISSAISAGATKKKPTMLSLVHPWQSQVVPLPMTCFVLWAKLLTLLRDEWIHKRALLEICFALHCIHTTLNKLVMVSPGVLQNIQLCD